MRVDGARLVPIPGSAGLACRFPGSALFVAATDAAGLPGELITRCRQASAAAPDAAGGTGLARQVAELVAAAAPDDRPDFALVTSTDSGPLVLVHGAVDVTATGADLVVPGGPSVPGELVRVSGADAPGGCVDRQLSGNVAAMTVGPHGVSSPDVGGGPADPVDLERGIVVAAGFRLVASSVATSEEDLTTQPPTAWYVDPEVGETAVQSALVADPPPEAARWQSPQAPPATPWQAPQPTPQPQATPVPPTGFRSVSLFDPEDGPEPPRKPLPVVTDPVEARSAEAEIGQVVVQGVVCPRGHFNDPRARFCSSCGISMAHQTRTLVPGPRPPLGVLVFEDGTTYSLSSNYVVGRQPETHPVVQSRQALPLVLEDGRRTISRAHAEIRLDGWDVHFINLSATNGSYLWDQQYQQWMALAPGQPVVLAPGMRIAMGQRTAVFESALVR